MARMRLLNIAGRTESTGESDSREESKQFFFEKKEPKNFCSWGFGSWLARVPISKSFLLLFFKKEGLSSWHEQASVIGGWYNYTGPPPGLDHGVAPT